MMIHKLLITSWPPWMRGSGWLGWLLFAACTGTEGDVLIGVPADLGDVAPDAAPAFSCQTGTEGGMCQAEASWQSTADKSCQVLGLALQSYLASQPCPGDLMAYQGVSFVCCPQDIVMGCVAQGQGEPGAPLCQNAAGWKMNAAASCQMIHLVLSGLTLLYPGGSCEKDGFGGAIYVCCPAN
jgi:hypothetical protein